MGKILKNILLYIISIIAFIVIIDIISDTVETYFNTHVTEEQAEVCRQTNSDECD